MARDLAHYRQLERRLWMARWRNAGQESAEEDPILDEVEGMEQPDRGGALPATP
jgi:hypothetical protein